MPLTSVSPGEVFTVRVYKQHNQFRWANTYEIFAISEQAIADEAFWGNIAKKFVDMEKDIHLQFVTVDRVVISSYVPDGTPYNPNSFISIPFVVNGTSAIMGDIAPANLCMIVRKNVTYGRDGRNFYRGTMTENHVVGGFPEATLSAARRSDVQLRMDNFYNDFMTTTIFTLCLARGKPNPTDVRQVTGLVVEARVTSKKPNNRYFKRNPGVPPP